MGEWLSKQNTEWVLSLWLRMRGNKLARNAGYLIAAAVAAVSNAVQLIIAGVFALFGKAIPIPDTPWWVVVLFVAAAVVLLVVDRIRPEAAPPPNPHDLILLKDIRDVFADNVKYFLRDEDLAGYSFEFEPINLLSRTRYVWKGPQFDFIDEEVQKAWTAVREKTSAFMVLIGTYTWPHDVGAKRQTPYPRGQYPEDCSDLTKEHIRQMNDAATELIETYDAFERVARRRLPQAG